MATGYQALTEKEKQTLRLMVRGYDAKSLARHLGLSVHTINERLRDARRKMGVSSSREAARLVLERQTSTHDSLADIQIREAQPPFGMGQDAERNTDQWRAHRAAWIVIGAVIMSIILGLFALSLVSDGTAPPAAQIERTSSETAAPATVGESEVVRSARAWLVLHDQGRWNDTWAGTATSFRIQNTLKQWSEVAEKVRVPLGAVVSRTALSQESVPAPPAGVEVVKFRTVFANKADAVETVSLAREGADWKIVGIYID